MARNWKVLWGTSIVATVFAVVCVQFDLLDIGEAEQGAFDDGLKALTAWTKNPKKSDDIVIVAIDDLTLQAVAKNESYALTFGSWPYSRNVWARVFEHLAQQGARAVVFDAVIDERHPDPSGDVAMGTSIGELSIPVFIGFNVSQSKATKAPPKVEVPTNRRPSPAAAEAAAGVDGGAAEGDEDETFDEGGDEDETFDEGGDEDETFDEGGDEAETFDEGDGGETFDEADGGETFDEADGYPSVTPEVVARALAFPVRGEGLSLPTLEDEEGRMRYPLSPIAPLVGTVSGFGLVVTEEDEDGKLRRTRFAYTDGINNYVTLSVSVVADLWDASEVVIAPYELRIGDRTIPINEDGTAEIDYGGPLEDRFEAVSMIHVLDDWLAVELATEQGDARAAETKLAPGTFKDKVVFIAGFALGTADVKPTPFAAQTPGVVKQAAEVQNLLDGKFIVEAPFWVSVLVTFLIAFFSVAIVLVFQAVLLEVGYPLLLFYGFFVVTGVFLVHQQLHILSEMPSWAAALAGTLAAVYNHVAVSRERERLKAAFAGRVKDEYLHEMVEQKVIPKLDGEFREVSLLVTDINDFSILAARYESDPEALARMTSHYLTAVTDVLLEHGGHVVKYIGDTVECVFGAPLDQPDHAVRACRAALAVKEVADSIDFGLSPEEQDRFHTRTGVVTVRAFVGNYGSEQAPEYTVLGRPMREAAEAATANERLNTRILLGPETVRRVRDHFDVREVASLELISGEPAIPLYELERIKQ